MRVRPCGALFLLSRVYEYVPPFRYDDIPQRTSRHNCYFPEENCLFGRFICGRDSHIAYEFLCEKIDYDYITAVLHSFVGLICHL